MSLEVYSLSSIATPRAVYLDNFYNYKQKLDIYEQGLQLNVIDAFKSTYDTSINNYTSHYLTGFKKISDFIDTSSIQDQRRTITTPLIFNNLSKITSPRVLDLQPVRNTDNTTLRILPEVKFTNDGNFFELEFINDSLLRVLHNNRRGYYALNVQRSESTAVFTKKITSFIDQGGGRTANDLVKLYTDVFLFHLDDQGYLQLYQYATDDVLCIVQLTIVSDSVSLTLINNTSKYVCKTTSVIKVNNNNIALLPKLQHSSISYDVSKLHSLKINSNKVTTNLSNQYLLHTNYNTVNNTFNLNYIELNNNRSELGFIKQGTNLNVASNMGKASTFREYTTLRTGNHQVYGDSNISLSYILYDRDIIAVSDTSTEFQTPQSLYPYKKLNVNDTVFTQNGSMGSTVPLLADRILNTSLTNSTFNSGEFICTWLCYNSVDNTYKWLDRYYYPDRISRQAALSASSMYIIASPIEVDSASENVKSVVPYVFDKLSDLAFEPGSVYTYFRVGKQNVIDILSKQQPVINNFDCYFTAANNTKVPYIGNSLNYDGSIYSSYDVHESINSTSQFTVAFDYYVDDKVSIGHSILNSYDCFTVVNNEQLTPLITLYQDREVLIYNTDYILIKRVKFNSNVKSIIHNSLLDGFFVVCTDGSITKVSTDGIKIRQKNISDVLDTSIVNYKSHTTDDNNIYFLLDSVGNVAVVDKYTLNTTYIKSTPLPLYSSITQPVNSIIIYNRTIYGVPGDIVKYQTNTKIFFLQGNKQIWRYDLVQNKARVLFDTGSSSVINDFDIVDDNIIFITNKNWYSYTLNRLFVLSGTTTTSTETFKNIHIDTVLEHTFEGTTQSTNLLMLSGAQGGNSGSLYISNLFTGVTTNLGISGIYSPLTSSYRRFFSMTDSNRFVIQEKNTLNFKLKLTNISNTADIDTVSIAIPVGTLDTGFHNFIYRFDAIQGNISLYINGVFYENKVIQPYKYCGASIINEKLYIGTTGFRNNSTLATYLEQPGYYFIMSSESFKNFRLYNIALLEHEIQALSLENKRIEDVVLSIPCGQRNNIEEIERYFKYATPTTSKNIDININNSMISTSIDKRNIKNIILSQAADILPVGVKINDIKFNNFNK